MVIRMGHSGPFPQKNGAFRLYKPEKHPFDFAYLCASDSLLSQLPDSPIEDRRDPLLFPETAAGFPLRSPARVPEV